MSKVRPSLYLLKATFIWLAGLISCYGLSAQTSFISGQVNNYFKVVEVIPSKACVKVNNVAGLSTVNKVMLIQMKGATITTSNNSSFGDTTALLNAGNYEIAYICYIHDDSVFFAHTILNSYTATTGKVQLVSIPEYQDAVVTDTIKPMNWNNTSGLGGVIALDVVGTLTLNAPVYADGSGFGGGTFVLSDGSCGNFFPPPATAYYYNATVTNPQDGAYKGETIVDLAVSMSGGKGAPASGGGGGNNHNNSGGGGANLTTGGRGGGNSSTNGCTATNKGEAGKALSSWGGKKIFLGGGGGAGHSNGGFSTPAGANGGGIVFIHANTIVANGFPITAGGSVGSNSVSDGAGGGGAGGTLILDVSSYTGSAILKSNGGNGGNSNDGGNSGRCFGGGGGGSGGAIYLSGSSPAGTVTSNAGLAGVESQRDPACATAQPALDGSAGSIINNYNYRRSSTISSFCGIPLPVTFLSFEANARDVKTNLLWTIENPELADRFILQRRKTDGGWQNLAEINADDYVSTYQFSDTSPLAGENQYRLLLIEKNGKQSYSITRFVFFGNRGYSVMIYPNPAGSQITINGDFNSANILLFDLQGRQLMQSRLFSIPGVLNLPMLPSGIYLLSVNGINKKLIIR